VAATAAALVVLGAGQQPADAQAPAAVAGENPYAPAYRHPYRHGAVPTLDAKARMDAYRAQHPAVSGSARAATDPLRFGGGTQGIGVTIGNPRVYLVFWGSAWGSAGIDGNGDLTLSGDPLGGAPRLQEMFKGLGTGGELWSGVMTQYCDDAVVGAVRCAPTGRHVPYPSGGVLAGVLYDGRPTSLNTTAQQIADEAADAARRFGNTTPASNRDAQYVILSPTGHHPDGFGTANFCAWHSGGISPTLGPIAFTNLPYVMDLGVSCGTNYVNPGAAGALDGYTIVAGHEYSETITDPLPRSGWTDPAGDENADKCAWIGLSPLVHGGAINVATGTGSFAQQGTWSNDSNTTGGRCENAHAVVPFPAVVPEVRGLGLGEAQQALVAAGLALGSTGSRVDCDNIGIVVSQSPAPGTTVLSGTAVNVTVGRRPDPPRVCP
jgi:serine protease